MARPRKLGESVVRRIAVYTRTRIGSRKKMPLVTRAGKGGRKK